MVMLSNIEAGARMGRRCAELVVPREEQTTSKRLHELAELAWSQWLLLADTAKYAEFLPHFRTAYIEAEAILRRPQQP